MQTLSKSIKSRFPELICDRMRRQEVKLHEDGISEVVSDGIKKTTVKEQCQSSDNERDGQNDW